MSEAKIQKQKDDLMKFARLQVRLKEAQKQKRDSQKSLLMKFARLQTLLSKHKKIS